MRSKICGITNIEDALCCVRNGADAIGFVFYEPSPRYITPLKAKEIIATLPPFVTIVGLFVNCEASFVNSVCKECKIDLAQIHFEADDKFYSDLEVKHIKVVRAKNEDDLKKFEDEYRLVDAFVESYGGEGKRVNLDWFRGIDCSKIILAGGLSQANLHELKKFGFYGVDVSSSVESTKGKKDHNKIDSFLKTIQKELLK
jgi:phosphoribosylanthranilate isomerase